MKLGLGVAMLTLLPWRGCAEANEASAGRAPVAAKASGAPSAAASAQPARFTAVISARHVANVAAQVEGTLRTVDVRLGDKVNEGDVIATIDDRLLRQAAAAARAVADTRSAAVRAALARAQHAAAELERGLKLQGEGLVTQQALATLKSADSEAQAEVLGAEAERREALALLDRAQRSLEWAVVRAPVSGTVALRFADPGNQVHLEQALVRIVADEAPWIRFGIPAEQRAQVAVGDAVTFVSLDGARGAAAHVVHIAPDVDPLSELVLAEGSLADPDMDLKPGVAGYVVAAHPPHGGSR